MSYQQSRQHCSICRAPAQEAVCGNRLLSRWDIWQLPREQVPALSWRCAAHQRYKMRPASRVSANELGDLCFTLTCGHQTQWVFRGERSYTQDMIERDLATRALRLELRQRCYVCGDLERKDTQAPC